MPVKYKIVEPFARHGNYVVTDTVFTDWLLPRITGNAYKVFTVIHRRIIGWEKTRDDPNGWVEISYSLMRELTGIKSNDTLRAAYKVLGDDLGLIFVSRRLTDDAPLRFRLNRKWSVTIEIVTEADDPITFDDQAGSSDEIPITENGKGLTKKQLAHSEKTVSPLPENVNTKTTTETKQKNQILDIPPYDLADMIVEQEVESAKLDLDRNERLSDMVNLIMLAHRRNNPSYTPIEKTRDYEMAAMRCILQLVWLQSIEGESRIWPNRLIGLPIDSVFSEIMTGLGAFYREYWWDRGMGKNGSKVSLRHFYGETLNIAIRWLADETAVEKYVGIEG